jgi:hypothetical protein
VDPTLRSRLRAGDPDAFGVLFDSYARAVYNLGFRLTGDWSAAEEVVSLTFLEAWRLRDRIDAGGESLRPWLLGIADLHCPYRGGVHDPTYRFLQSLPTDPHALLSLIEQQMQGQQPRPEEAFNTIGDLLREAVAPPQVSAALYRAAALIPGVTVVPDATDAIGRHGVAVAMTYQGVRTEWIFNKQTLQYLGEHDINIANGSTTGEAAVLQRAFVDHAGQIPR